VQASEQKTTKKKKKGIKQLENDAAVFIQRRFRGMEARRDVVTKKEGTAASKIQCVFRGRKSRDEIDRTNPGFRRGLQQIKMQYRALRTRNLKRDFGESVLDVVRCLLHYKVSLKVEDGDYNTLLHLAAQTGDIYGPPLIRMLLRQGAPNHRKNKRGQAPYDLAVSRDHAACALALRPVKEVATGRAAIMAKMNKEEETTFETSPTEYHIVSMSPFMKTLGDLLYCRPWPAAYRALLEDEQPQRARERLPDEPPVEFLATVDETRRTFEAPFEVKDRQALANLCTAASPRIRKAPKEEQGAYAVKKATTENHDPEADDWLVNMLELMADHKEVDNMVC
jgi:hypothetical protein